MRRLTNDLSGYNGMTITADGRQIASRHETSVSRVWIAPAASPSEARPLTSNPRDQIGTVAIEADGTVSFSRTDPSGMHVWRLSPGESEVRLTQSDQWFDPAVSADGSILLAHRRRGSEATQLWRLDPETGEPVVDSGSIQQQVLPQR